VTVCTEIVPKEIVPEENYVEVNGTTLCWFEWGQRQRDAETILLIHATGFHARCWDQTIKHLNGRHVIAVDLRGHGRSAKKGPYTWTGFGTDTIEFVRALDLDNMIGVGHSMGGHCLTQAVASEQGRFARAILVDPVIMDPEVYERMSQSSLLDESAEHPVARRRNQFADAQAMFDNFEGRGSYSTWQKESLQDYCEYGLLPDPGGVGYNLACPPEVEASIYMGNHEADVHELARQINLPVTILRAKQRDLDSMEMDFSMSPTWSGLASLFPNGRDVHLPHLTHFMPNQAPQLVAQYILGKK
jgi:pimeloyl-ACP methyl ester carboxylesterase